MKKELENGDVIYCEERDQLMIMEGHFIVGGYIYAAIDMSEFISIVSEGEVTLISKCDFT